MMLRSPQYLAFVRLEPCCCPGCDHPCEEAHHFSKKHGGGGGALKPHDTFTVPLCSWHHRFCLHSNGALPGMTAQETLAYFCRVALQLVTRYWLDKMQTRRPGSATEVF